jgi:hypothetical protein
MRYQKAAAVLAVLLAACGRPAEEQAEQTVTQTRVDSVAETPELTSGIDRKDILGAWSADGQNFTWVIDTTTILFEIDMKPHPYRLVADTLIIDREDPTIGIQKTRIVRLAGDTMMIEDVLGGSSERLFRLR